MEPTARSDELADFELVFTAAHQSQIDVVLVGGQAVYFWANRYRSRCQELGAYLPYTSKDLDLLADIPNAMKLAQALESQFQPMPRKGGMLGLCLGYIPLPHDLKLEILGRINGVKVEAVRHFAILSQGLRYDVKVIDPVQLFIAKGCNVAQLDQSKRQDAKHFAIMQWVVREFLADLINTKGETDPRFFLDACEALMRFVLEETGLKLLASGHMPPPVFWPDLTDHPNEKLRNFIRLRVPRWRQQLDAALEKVRPRQPAP